MTAAVCIIGSGPAGLTIARELALMPGGVILLESGLREPDVDADALNEIESVGVDRVIDQTLVRHRRLGGTSASWSGRVAAFDEMDFARRDWVANSGWPISRASLAPYLKRSATYLGVAVADNITGAPNVPSGGLDDEDLRSYLWSYSADESDPHDFMRFGRSAYATSDRVDGVVGYLGATVTHIDTTPEGHRVTGLEVRDIDGAVHRVEARITILCAGGIENARLLLASDRIVQGGVGNGRDLVGRYLADHPRGAAGLFDPHASRLIQERFAGYQKILAGRRVSLTPGLVLSADIQRRERLLNCSMWLADVRHPDDPFGSVIDLLRRRGSPMGHVRNILRGTPLLARGALSYVTGRRSPVRRVDELSLQVMVEQVPDRESRVTLADRTDRFGTRLARIDWRIGESEARTVRRAAVLFVDRMRELGLPEPRLLPMIADADLPFRFPDVAHPSGTTRMAADVDHGVVDENCAVHGVEGLYIAGSSIFPTNGHANPTQMIVALAIRLADEVKRVIAQ